jgi:hypothetical protein
VIQAVARRSETDLDPCPRWNRYKCGPDRRSGYVGLPGATQIRTQYPARIVTYLGLADTGNEDLDRGCEARYQGRHRLRRGQIFFDFMNMFFPGHRHTLVTVPGARHSASEMYLSPEGRDAVF